MNGVVWRVYLGKKLSNWFFMSTVTSHDNTVGSVFKDDVGLVDGHDEIEMVGWIDGWIDVLLLLLKLA